MVSPYTQNASGQPPKHHKERRQFTRFIPKNGTMVINDNALGPVINISMGGLCFQYMDDKNNAYMSDLFGIFLGSDNILIDKIKSRVISDTLETRKSSFMQTRTHLRSIQFLNLTPEQQSELENFILTKTRGVV